MPTMGYDKDGVGHVFEIADAKDLPKGFTAECPPWAHPNSAHLHKRPEPETPKAPELEKPPIGRAPDPPLDEGDPYDPRNRLDGLAKQAKAKTGGGKKPPPGS